jgi:hypothetical protein
VARDVEPLQTGEASQPTSGTVQVA